MDNNRDDNRLKRKLLLERKREMVTSSREGNNLLIYMSYNIIDYQHGYNI